MRTFLAIIAAASASVGAGCLFSDEKCDHPAPLLGTRHDSQALFGFLVKLHDGVDVAAEAARLGDVYGFHPGLLFTTGATQSQLVPEGFFAKVNDDDMQAIRCEPAVTSVSFDSIHSQPEMPPQE